MAASNARATQMPAMLGATVTLRSATPHDADRLLAWRADPAAIAASFSPPPVNPRAHARWLDTVLADPHQQVYIIETAGHAVGVVRLNGEDVSLVVDQDWRRRGIARMALDLLAKSAKEERGLTRLVARIKVDNEPSRRAFRTAGFRETVVTAMRPL